jgi:hypothetical protein
MAYSQVCYLDCAFNGCSEYKEPIRQNEQSGHCHQEKKEPVSPERNEAPGCPSHAELSALMTSTLASVKIFNLDLHTEAAPLASDIILIHPPDKPAPGTDNIPLRPPPKHSVLRI